MTTKEFEIQQKIGAIPKDSILLDCRRCNMSTPQMVLQRVFSTFCPDNLIIAQYTCCICRTINDCYCEK